MKMIREYGNWIEYRQRFNLSKEDEIDLHFGRRDRDEPYENVMADVAERVTRQLQKAQENGRPYIMFVHGHSTSRPGQTSARSVVRGLMRSPETTPLIEIAKCIQHPSVFVAKIRQSSQVDRGP